MEIDTQAYAVKHRNLQTLLNSSSGGAFTAVSDFFLDNGMPVICSIYNYQKHKVEFKMVQKKADRDSARGSKYMQSVPGEIFAEAYEWLSNNPEKKLMFIGVGCQAEGFRLFCEKKSIRNRVFIVDIICHGVPSPQFWEDYISRYSAIDYLTFKDKKDGWNTPRAYVKSQGREILLKEYIKMYYDHAIIRPSCFECQFAKTNRNVDMTIGDFWGIERVKPEFYDRNGISLVLLHTTEGCELFEKIKSEVEYESCSLDECLQPNLVEPTERPLAREQFWNDYRNKGVMYVIRKYGRDSIHIRIFRKIKRMLKK